MLFYGKSAIGLAEDLNILLGSTEIYETYPAEVNKYMYYKKAEYLNFINFNYTGKDSLTAKKAFIKQEHSFGRFMPEIVTADDLVNRFYDTFPRIKEVLSGGAERAAIEGFITTKDIFERKRFFGPTDVIKEQKAIIRQAMNYCVQAGGANMTKYAIVIIDKYIEEHNLGHKVQFCWPIHDELLYMVHEDFAEEWLKIQIRLMEEAGEFVLGHKYQKAEGHVTAVWEK
jgi:DNA polymerase I-like protein with 3'-5' exonuclease and polymerase domains